MSKIHYLTLEGLEKLKAEHHQLVSVERPLMSKQIAEARDKGDLSENAEYDAAKEAQGLLELKIAKLEDMIANARENIRTVRDIFGNNIEIAVENNNYYPTPVYKTITDSSFLSTIVNENNIAFLFDIAHAKVTAHNRNICFDEYTEGLPLNRCVQLHISEFGINSRGIAYDVHEEPGRELYACIKNLLSRYKKIKYVTVEYYKSIDRLLFIISQIKEIVISL